MRTKRSNPAASRRYGRGLVLAMVALLSSIFAVSCGASPGGEARQAERPPERLGNPTLGAADAPVVMVEWGDFR